MGLRERPVTGLQMEASSLVRSCEPLTTTQSTRICPDLNLKWRRTWMTEEFHIAMLPRWGTGCPEAWLKTQSSELSLNRINRDS